jgi:hypothetical protein
MALSFKLSNIYVPQKTISPERIGAYAAADVK